MDAPHFAAQTRFLADIFLRLIRMIVAPLIFGGLVTGIAGHGELRGVGRVALKAIIFFEVVTTLGLILGAIAINLSQAGVGVALPAALGAAAAPAAHAEGWQQMLLNVFPENIAQAVAQNQILQVAVFALLFGAALAMLPEPRRAPLVSVLQSLTDTMFRLTQIVMLMAPVAAGAALAYTVGSMGLATLLPLAKLVVTYYAALAAFRAAGARAHPACWRAFRCAVLRRGRRARGHRLCHHHLGSRAAAGHGAHGRVRRAALDRLLRHSHRLQLQHDRLQPVSLHGRVFAAQAAGMHLTVGEQFMMLATLMLTSKGVAGVPRAVLVILLGTAGSFHIPTAAIMMLLGVDTLMDMGRTAMNVIGNCMASAVVARWEGEPKAAATPQELQAAKHEHEQIGCPRSGLWDLG